MACVAEKKRCEKACSVSKTRLAICVIYAAARLRQVATLDGKMARDAHRSD